MNLPPQLQQEVEKWANLQGIDPEQFVVQTIAEKVSHLNEQEQATPSLEHRLYRKNGVLVVDVAWDETVDVNQLIDQVREERMQEILGESTL